MWIDFAGQFQKSLTALPLKTYQAAEMVPPAARERTSC